MTGNFNLDRGQSTTALELLCVAYLYLRERLSDTEFIRIIQSIWLVTAITQSEPKAKGD